MESSIIGVVVSAAQSFHELIIVVSHCFRKAVKNRRALSARFILTNCGLRASSIPASATADSMEERKSSNDSPNFPIDLSTLMYGCIIAAILIFLKKKSCN